MIPLEEVREKAGVRGQEAEDRGQESGVRSRSEQAGLSRSESRQCPGVGIPPGVDNKGPQFNAQAVFSPDERVETGGCEFNGQGSGVMGQESGERGLMRVEPARSLVEEVVPGLPRPAPLRRQGVARVLTDEVKENFFLLLSVGLSRRQAAARLAWPGPNPVPGGSRRRWLSRR